MQSTNSRTTTGPTTTLTPQLTKVLLGNRLYSQHKIETWFDKFLIDCPDGKVDGQKLLTVFKRFYNEKKSIQLVENTLTAVGKVDNNQYYLDFAGYVLAINLICVSNADDKLSLAASLHIYNRNMDAQAGSGDESIRREDATKILQTIATLLGFRTYEHEGRAVEEYKSPYRQRVDKIFDGLRKEELSHKEFVTEFLKDSAVKGLLQTRF